MVCRGYCDREVRRVGVGASIGDADQEGSVVLQLEATRVVLKLATVYTLGSVDASLVNKPIDDAIEVTPIENVRMAHFTCTYTQLYTRQKTCMNG